MGSLSAQHWGIESLINAAEGLVCMYSVVDRCRPVRDQSGACKSGAAWEQLSLSLGN